MTRILSRKIQLAKRIIPKLYGEPLDKGAYASLILTLIGENTELELQIKLLESRKK